MILYSILLLFIILYETIVRGFIYTFTISVFSRFSMLGKSRSSKDFQKLCVSPSCWWHPLKWKAHPLRLSLLHSSDIVSRNMQSCKSAFGAAIKGRDTSAIPGDKTTPASCFLPPRSPPHCPRFQTPRKAKQSIAFVAGHWNSLDGLVKESGVAFGKQFSQEMKKPSKVRETKLFIYHQSVSPAALMLDM